MHFFKKGIMFFFHHIRNNPVYLLAFIINSLKRDFSFKVSFYSAEQLAREVQHGRSLIRIGDGEVCIMNKGDVHYQKYNPEIDKTLLDSIKNYTEKSGYIICINEHVMNKTNAYLRKVKQFRTWLPMKTYYSLYFNKNVTYGDASIFNYKNYFETYFYPFLKDKVVILVGSTRNVQSFKERAGNVFKTIYYIETKEKNAFDDNMLLHERIDSIIKDFPRESIVILASHGPAGKVLVADYCQKGITSIDLGIGVELIFSEKVTPYSLLPKEPA